LSRGHAVAILRTHRADITDPALASGEHAALLEAVQRVARGMKAHLRCDRVYAITMSDVVQHLHYHLVPRYPGEAKGFPFWTEKAAGGAIPVDRDALEHLASALRHAVER
jgi:diadenosine tetraphosphate (Ap4A) HIT family hydrolase